MAIYTPQKVERVKNVKDLKKFLEHIPDNTKLAGDFPDELITACYMEKKEGKGPRTHVQFRSE